MTNLQRDLPLLAAAPPAFPVLLRTGGTQQMAAEQYHKHQRFNSLLELNTAQNNKLMAPSQKGRMSYLDCLQKLTTSSPDVFKGTSLGQHEEMSQDLVQVAVGGTSKS